MSFSQIPWFLLCGGLTVLGLIGSWLVGRRRGARAAMRGVAWSLLPIALYLIGIIQPIWNFAYGLVFSPKVWTGLVVMAVAVLLFAVTGGMRSRARTKQDREKPARDKPARDKQDATATGPGQLTTGSVSRAAPPAKRKGGGVADDEDFGEVAAILKRHGIS